MDNLFEQAAQITKAHGYDILANQVKELKEENKELAATLKMIQNMDTWQKYFGGGAIDKKITEALKNRKPYNL